MSDVLSEREIKSVRYHASSMTAAANDRLRAYEWEDQRGDHRLAKNVPDEKRRIAIGETILALIGRVEKLERVAEAARCISRVYTGNARWHGGWVDVDDALHALDEGGSDG